MALKNCPYSVKTSGMYGVVIQKIAQRCAYLQEEEVNRVLCLCKESGFRQEGLRKERCFSFSFKNRSAFQTYFLPESPPKCRPLPPPSRPHSSPPSTVALLSGTSRCLSQQSYHRLSVVISSVSRHLKILSSSDFE